MAAHQTKLNVIGNNIANVNTYGFKASRVVFSDVLYQNLSTATAATNTTGGTNASQLGYGAKVASIDMLNTISSGATTGRALDVYIAGEGYLAVQPEAGSNRYTRVGNLKFDAEGNLTDGNGSKVMGIPTDADGNPILDANGTLAINGLQAINIPKTELEKYTGITIGKSGEITGIKAGDPEFTAASGTAWIKNTSLSTTTNLGGNVTMSYGYMVPFTAGAVAGATVDRTANLKGTINVTKNGTAYSLDLDPTTGLTDKTGKAITSAGNPTVSADGILTFANIPGLKIDTVNLVDGTTSEMGSVGDPETEPSIIGTVYDQGGTAITKEYPWDLTATDPVTVTFGDLSVTIDPAVLSASKEFTNTKIGTIEAGSDKPVTLGYLAIAKFANTDGLLQDGNGYFMESANSGEAIASKAGTNGTGATQSANLEMSNVDLSQEFTDMIVAQRGFQANSRIITVSDSILEELINLKR